MKLKGKIIHVLQEQSGIGKNGETWRLQPYVLETFDNYPRKVYFEIFGDQRIKENVCWKDQIVTISFDIESREYNGRWYTVVRAWKVEHDTPEPASDDENANNTDGTFDASKDSNLF